IARLPFRRRSEAQAGRAKGPSPRRAADDEIDLPAVAGRAAQPGRPLEKLSVFLPSGGLLGRRSPTHQAAGLHRTMVKVCKPDCEETIAGTRGNGEDAPIPAIRSALIEPAGATKASHSREAIASFI